MAQLISLEEKRELRKKQITLLVKSYYEKLEFLHYEPLNLLIDKALDLFLDSDLTIDEINDKLIEAITSRKKSLMERYDDNKVRDNHETIYGQLEQLSRLMSKIDYQLAGALCGYLKYDEESKRVHDDIDICLNEDDLEKFQDVCLDLGYQFEDNRLDSPRILKDGIPSGEHELMAIEPNTNFHVGVFPFERGEDGSVRLKEYFENDDGVPFVREEIFNPELSKEIFGRETIDFRGTPIIITPPEYVYLLKSYTNHEKDRYDMDFFESRMDRDKMLRLRNLLRDGKRVDTFPVEDVPTLHNPFNDDTKDLSFMFEDNEFKINEDSISSMEKEGTKVRVKKKEEIKSQEDMSMSEEGFISNAIITTLAIITFVLCAIGIAIIYLVQM